MAAKRVWGDRVKQAAGSAPNGSATTFDVSTSASSGFIKFESIPGLVTGDLVSYRAAAGSLWECGIGAIDTSGHTVARTTITSNSSGSTSKIDFSSGAAPELVCDLTGRDIGQAILIDVAGTDAATTCLIGMNFDVPIGSFTGDRIYTFPASPSGGDRFAVTAATYSASYECILKTNSDKTCILNGAAIPVSTEVTRLIIAGEKMVFRYSATSGTWLIDQDHRVPITVVAAGTNASMSTGTIFYPDWTASVDNSGAYVNATKDCFTARRAGTFVVQSALLTAVQADQSVLTADFITDPNGTPVFKDVEIRVVQGASNRQAINLAQTFVFPVDTQITAAYTVAGAGGTTAGINFALREQL